MNYLTIITISIIGFNLTVVKCQGCDLRPLESKSQGLTPDNSFKIEIPNMRGDKYIPNTKYNVTISAINNYSFVAFSLIAKESYRYNHDNPRRPHALQPGSLIPIPPNSTYSLCNSSIIVQSNVLPKMSVTVTWMAPPKSNECVTISALVAVRPNEWYMNVGTLSRKVCEDKRNADDMQPEINENCQICTDARYELTFEGLWTKNTHRDLYPEHEVGKFSDIVGASHDRAFSLWKENKHASDGLRMLAEQGNTTQLEMEIQQRLPSNVRTIIKSKGPPDAHLTSRTTFRVNQEKHLVSLVTAIRPSPDWFLGVANFELCKVDKVPTWTPSLKLNLYPLDAGTDSGTTFESANEETSPPQPISTSIDVTRDLPKDELNPFARIHFRLIRTYPRLNCVVQETENNEGASDYGVPSEVPEVITPYPFWTSTVSYRNTEVTIPVPDPASDPDCPLSEWGAWFSCEGPCVNDVLRGYRIRQRYPIEDKPDCSEDTETVACEEPCGDAITEEINAASHLANQPNWPWS